MAVRTSANGDREALFRRDASRQTRRPSDGTLLIHFFRLGRRWANELTFLDDVAGRSGSAHRRLRRSALKRLPVSRHDSERPLEALGYAGKVLPGGGLDAPRGDGVLELDLRITLETTTAPSST